MSFGLEQETLAKIVAVFVAHPEVDKVLIYGSRAKGNYRRGSDIDLTLIGKSINTAILNVIRIELDDLNTPYLFDLSLFDSLRSPDLESHIARVGQVFYLRQAC